MNLYNFLSESKLKRYINLIIIVAVGLFLVGGYFLWIPKYQEFRNNKTIFDNKDEEIRVKKEYLRELNGHLVDVLEHEEELLLMEEGVPYDYSLPTLYSFIRNLASVNGVYLEEISYEKVIDKKIDAPKKIELSFNVSSEYPSFKNFILKLHENSRFFNIKSLEFSSPTERIGLRDMFDFELVYEVAYYEKPLEELVK